jgi:hypothetical protein
MQQWLSVTSSVSAQSSRYSLCLLDLGAASLTVTRFVNPFDRVCGTRYLCKCSPIGGVVMLARPVLIQNFAAECVVPALTGNHSVTLSSGKHF